MQFVLDSAAQGRRFHPCALTMRSLRRRIRLPPEPCPDDPILATEDRKYEARRIVVFAIYGAMIERAFILTCCVLSLFIGSGWSQNADAEHRLFQIGEINYFGYGGLPLEKIRAVLPWHVGDTLTFATFSRKPVVDAITSAIGKPPTDVNVTCCDASQHLEIFIGLPGSTSRSVPTAPAPSGNIHLNPEGLRLYEQEQPLLQQAVVRGNGGEDDSWGYMVSSDPALKAVNLAMRSYAVGREAELKQVLQTASDPKDRRAAATLLGYVRRSPAQAEALSPGHQRSGRRGAEQCGPCSRCIVSGYRRRPSADQCEANY